MKYISETFDSIDRMLHVIGSRPNNKGMEGQKDSQKHDKDFTGTKSYEEAKDLIVNGWEDPLKEFKEIMRSMSVKTNVTSDKHRPLTGVVGYAPCVPNALRGLPNSMISTEHIPTKVRALTIIYNACGSANTKTKEFLESGTAVLKLVNELELAGYRVRLILEYMMAEENSLRVVGRVSLKDWRQPLDLKKLTFPFAHASMLRRFGFKWLETVPGLADTSFKYGYGKAVGNRDKYENIVKSLQDNGLLTDKEFYINMQMAKAEKYDTDRIMSRAGMKLER